MKKILVLLFCVFIVISFICLYSPMKETHPGDRSVNLNKEIAHIGNIEQITYKNHDGIITFATDLGYAIKRLKRIKGQTLEEYLDVQGQPIYLDGGYHALLREYDDNGNEIKDTYLGVNKEPVNADNGYSIVVRKHNKANKTINEEYYDKNGEAVCSGVYGYGKIIEYNSRGQIAKVTYLDKDGYPMITKLGFAIETRTYYMTDDQNNGRTKEVFYFDQNSIPIALSLGQYGVLKEYDEYGQEYKITYLDMEGEPIITNKGYTTVIKAYNDAYTLFERYYDINGNPFALSEGQYGISKANNKINYLDIDGEETINIKRILYNHSWVIIPLSLLCIVAAGLTDKKYHFVFFTLYVLAIAYFTIMFREKRDGDVVSLFNHYKLFFTTSSTRVDIIRNVWLFVPLGTFLYHLCPKWIILLVPVLLSIFIEGMQYFFSSGFCEIDDVVSNTFGGYIGFHASKLTYEIVQRIKSRRYIQTT